VRGGLRLLAEAEVVGDSRKNSPRGRDREIRRRWSRGEGAEGEDEARRAKRLWWDRV